MKIEIEVSEEDAALIVANTWNEKTLKEACEQLAKDEAASYARAFPDAARKLRTEAREKAAENCASIESTPSTPSIQ